MVKKCTNIYKGKPYSMDRLKRVIISEMPVVNQGESIKWLSDYLGMSSDEVITVTGLIDNKSLGRFREDGRILLSDLAGLDTAKHEAFHKVWRTYLTVDERATALREFKLKNKDWKSTTNKYRSLYPSLDENDLLEEYFADEFGAYTMQPTSYKIMQPLRSFFDRLYNFLQKILGLKPIDVQQIYDKILSKSYKTNKSITQYPKAADSVLIQGQPFSIAERNEITNYLTQQFIANVVNSKAGVEGFIDGTASEKVSILISILQGKIDESDLSEELFQAIDADLEKGKTNMLDSEFLTRVMDNLRLLGLEIEMEPNEESEIAVGDTMQTREFTPAIKVNPKAGLTGKIKILLSSFQHPTNMTDSGVPEVISWGQAFNQITNKMVGIPTKYFLEEMLQANLVIGDQLSKFLGWNGSEWTNQNIQFRNEFISKMSLTENRFLMMLFGKDIRTGKSDIYMSDLNSETRTDNVIKRWKTNIDYRLSNLIDDDVTTEDVYKQIAAQLQESLRLTNAQERVNKVLDILGIDVNEEVKPHIVKQVNFMLDSAVKAVANPKFDTKSSVYVNLNIEGDVKKIAELESAYEDQRDLMINSNGINLYAMGLNTQQTIMSNKIKYLVNRGTKEGKSGTALIEYLKTEMPEVFNEWNLTMVDGQYQINKLLIKYLTGGVQLSIPYIVKNEREDTAEVSKLNEPDLAMMHIIGALKGQYISLKHSDRSTFFSYDVGQPLYTSNQFDSESRGIEHIRLALINEILIEIKFAQATDQHQPMQFISGDKLGYAALLGEKRFAELVAGDSISDKDKTTLGAAIEQEFNSFVADVQNFGLYEIGTDKTGEGIVTGGHVAGLSKAELSKYNSRTKSGLTAGGTDLADIRLMLMAAFTNESVFHMQESRLYSGDNRVFKNVSDLYKRLAAQSSNGLLAVTDSLTNKYIKDQLQREYEVFDIASGKMIKVNTADHLNDTKFRAVTLRENDFYKARNLDPAVDQSGNALISRLGIANPTELAMSMEYGFLMDNPNPDAEQKEWMIGKIESAESAYAGINENDGQSYMTLPAFKNYMNRFGTWTDEMEVSYQIEMELLKYKDLQSAKNMEITIQGTKKYDGITFKPFDIGDGNFKKRLVGDREVNLEAMHTLKTQYSGNNMQESMFNKGTIQYSFLALFKTSQHLLQPSAIMGTNLQAMNVAMLRNATQIVHMGSANKVGGVDPQKAAKQILDNSNDSRNTDPRTQSIYSEGLEFYGNDGTFNSDNYNFSANPENGFTNYLADWEYLKDQVKIGNKEKSEITGSTQSLKLMMSNLLINGEERFPGAMEIVNQYKALVKELVQQNAKTFFTELGWNGIEFNDINKVRDIVLASSQIQNSPENIKNEVINFFEDTSNGLETLTFRGKIENVLYALITKNIIDFKRPGNSYPQAASTGYEAYGSRELVGKTEKGRPIFKSAALDFYKPVFDSTGNVIKVLPAEIILPLPSKWIKPLMKASGQTNIIDAIDWLNNLSSQDKGLASDRFLVKGLRIPNQQLSSNDMFRIKKFLMPTIQNYVIVPSELVIKVGSDFDVDKENLYWADMKNNLFGGPGKKVSSDQKLLSIEAQILLHPKNIQHLLMPLGNDIFVGDLYRNIFTKEGFVAKDNDTMFSILNPMTNVKKAIIFVKGKQAVGIGAKGITFHAVNQVNADGASILDDYIVGYTGKGDPIYQTTRLRFEGLKGEGRYFGNYIDSEGNLVSEIMSQLLTMYVDGVKEPYAVLMNITMQTANVVDYLIKVGLSAKQITFFLSQPLIIDYLLAQKINESLFIKNDMISKVNDNEEIILKSREQSKYDLISSIRGMRDRITSKPKDPKLIFRELDSDWMITDLKPSLVKAGQKPDYSNEKYYTNQKNILQHYLEINDLSKAYGHFAATQDSDTKSFASINDVLLSKEMRNIVDSEYIVSSETVRRYDVDGLVSPFYQYGRKSYDNLYKNMYQYSANGKFSDYINFAKFALASEEKGEKKERLMQTLENDFMLFLAHNFYFAPEDSNRLLRDNKELGTKSVAKRVKELKIKIPGNMLLKALQPMIGQNTDPLTGDRIDNLRLYEKNLESTDANDLSQSLQEINDLDAQLYKDIVHLLYFQNGYNPGILNYFQVIPVGLNSKSNNDNTYQYLTQEVNKTVNQAVKQLSEEQVEDLFKRFLMLFDLNNSQFIKKQQNNHLVRKQYDTKSERIKFLHRVSKADVGLRLLGNKFMKRYNLSYYPELPTGTVTKEAQKSIDTYLPNIKLLPDNVAKTVNVQMQPDNIQRILDGSKTTTIRSESQAKEIGLNTGESGIITFENIQFRVTNRGLLSIAEAGGKEKMIGSEGLTSETDFKYQQSKDWINGKGKLHVYDIKRIDNPSNTETIGKGSVEIYPLFWTRDSVELQDNKVFLFGDNTNDRTVTNYVPSSTQAVIRGLPNAIGIDTKKDRNTNEGKLFNFTDKELKKGAVVEYNGNKYLFWNNNNGKAQIINVDGTKFSGTPNVDKLTVLGNYNTIIYNNVEYIVTDKNNIYSGATGNLVYTGNDNSSVVQKQRIIEKAKADVFSSYFNDEDFDVFKEQVDNAIQQAKNSGKIIVIPADGIGTGKAMLKEKAPKLFNYLQSKLSDLKSDNPANTDSLGKDSFILDKPEINFVFDQSFDTNEEEGIQSDVESEVAAARLAIFNKYGVKQGRQTTEISKYANLTSLIADIAEVNRQYGNVLELLETPDGKWHLRQSSDPGIHIPDRVDNAEVAQTNSTEFNLPLGQMGQDLVENWSNYFEGYDDLSESDKTAFAQLMEAGLLKISCKL